MARYVGLIDGEDGAYGVIFPDLPGCTAMGDTVEQALSHASDALSDWTTATEAMQRAVPAPRLVADLRTDPDVAEAIAEGAVLATVTMIRKAGRTAKANLSLDAGVLRAIDEAADAHKLTRSAMVELLARQGLARAS